MYNTKECPKDGSMRSENLRERCGTCGGRKYWWAFNAYLTKSEYDEVIKAALIILFTAVSVGVLYGIMRLILGSQLA